MEKKCNKCGEVQDVSNFYRSQRTKDGWATVCKYCSKAYRKELAKQPGVLERRRKSKKKWRDSPNGKEYGKRYHHAPEQLKKYREYHAKIAKDPIKGPELRRKMREYSQRPEVKARRNELTRLRKLNDPMFRLITNYRNRIYIALKDNPKTTTTTKIIGCSLPHLRKHLESKFEEWMTWDNYGQGRGKWQVDHIVPCAAFDMSNPKDQRICFGWQNLQPMCAIKNTRKKTKTDGQLHLL